MRKLRYLILILFVFLFIGVVNVNAETDLNYQVSSLQSGGYTVTINKFLINLYEVPADNSETLSLFPDPPKYSFEMPSNIANAFFGTNTVKATGVNISKGVDMPISLVELTEGTLSDEEDGPEGDFEDFLGEYLATLESQENPAIDGSKDYYGDIEVVYTISGFPESFKTFTQVNGFRTVLKKFPEIFSEISGSEVEDSDSIIQLGKAPWDTKNLTSGSSLQTKQMLNLFVYGKEEDSTSTELSDKLNIVTELEGDDLDAGIYGFNYGLFSESDTFNIDSVYDSDRAIMFSVMPGMENYLKEISLATLGDDYVGDLADDSGEGRDVVKVGNTAASQNTILVVIGLILVLSGTLLISRVKKRYN